MNNLLINLTDVTQKYTSIKGGVTQAITNLNLKIYNGEFLTIVGMSGSGKSTLLKILAKIETPSAGNVSISNNQNKIKVGVVFQENSIFPWRTVGENISFPLELENTKVLPSQIRVDEILNLIGLNPKVYKNKYPKELSGGEKRRVAIGMALAHNAKILLLDEPTSQLDDINKWTFQKVILDLWEDKKFTCVLVTHDIEEAIFLGDRVLILKEGEKHGLVEIDFPRPRPDEIRGTEKFYTYRKNIASLL